MLPLAVDQKADRKGQIAAVLDLEDRLFDALLRDQELARVQRPLGQALPVHVYVHLDALHPAGKGAHGADARRGGSLYGCLDDRS